MDEAEAAGNKKDNGAASSSLGGEVGRGEEDEGEEGMDLPPQGADKEGGENTAAPPASSSTTAAATWTCAHCSLVNDEPEVQGGVVSCSVCLMVRGQEAWLCPACTYMNTSLKAKACKMCSMMAFGGRTSGGGSRGDDIARDYKRRKRVHNKPRSSSSGAANASGGGGSGSGGGGGASSAAVATPMTAAASEEAIRTEHSLIFGQQLKTMHRLVRELQVFPAFRDICAEMGDEPTCS